MDSTFDPVAFAKECIRERIEHDLPTEILYATIDMNRLTEITGHSETYLRKHFIVTKEAKALECSPTTKNLWKYPEIRDCWRDFCDRQGKRMKNEELHI